MSTAKPPKGEKKAKPWVWMGLLAFLAVAAIAVVVSFAMQRSGERQEPEVGHQVQPFQLPDVISGITFSLDDYLGKEDVVLVSYMGFF
jgi:flagellar basal body-associated protein FliL